MFSYEDTPKSQVIPVFNTNKKFLTTASDHPWVTLFPVANPAVSFPYLACIVCLLLLGEIIKLSVH